MFRHGFHEQWECLLRQLIVKWLVRDVRPGQQVEGPNGISNRIATPRAQNGEYRERQLDRRDQPTAPEKAGLDGKRLDGVVVKSSSKLLLNLAKLVSVHEAFGGCGWVSTIFSLPPGLGERDP